MFEKEAEEIANKKLCANMMCYNHCNFNSPKHHRCGDWHRCYEIAKASAEYGYNKANEWHFVKDGDLPKTKKRVLVLLKDVEEPILDYYRQDGLWNYALENEVIAWKEIVLPELPKESV